MATAGSFLAPQGGQLRYSKRSPDVDRIETELRPVLAARVNDDFERAVTFRQIDRDPVKGRIDRVSSDGTASDALQGKCRALNLWFRNHHCLGDTVGKLYLVAAGQGRKDPGRWWAILDSNREPMD